MVGANLEERFRQLLRTGTDNLSVVCRPSIFSGRIFGDSLAAGSTRPAAPELGAAKGDEDGSMEEGEAKVFLGSGYTQCKADRRSITSTLVNTLDTNNLTKLAQKLFITSFDTPGNTDTEKTFIATRHNTHQNTKQNLTASFDPKTLTCTACTPTHGILNTYRDNTTHPLTLVYSDQNFNCTLAGYDNNSLCVKIMRLEDGSLRDGVDLIFEIFGKGGLPAGTVILLGSLSDLVAKGSSGYSWEYVEQKNRLECRWPAARVGLLPPIPLAGGPVSLYRSVAELRGWIASVLGTDPTGLLPVWNAVLNELQVNKTPGTENDYYTVQFPANLSTNPTATYLHYETVTLSPAQLPHVDRKANLEIVRALFRELNTGFSCGLGPGVSLERVEDSRKMDAKDSVNYITIGASHMVRVAAILKNAGNEVSDLAESSWVLSETTVSKIVEKLGTVKKNSSTVVIIDPVSNSATKFKQADDSLSLAQKMEGGWHLPGEIVMVDGNQIHDSIKKLKPVLDMLTSCKKIFIPPTPRYIFAGCCGKSGHCTNTKNTGYQTHMLQEHTRIRANIKEHVINPTPTHHRKNFRILDLIGTLNTNGAHSLTQQLQALKDHTSRDNVHLTHEGYYKISAAVAREAAAMLKEDAVTAVPAGGGRPIPYWHGFVVHQGVGRTGGRADQGGGMPTRGGRGGRGGKNGRGRHHPYVRRGQP
jgi:lysophospholipase L1-like esterase